MATAQQIANKIKQQQVDSIDAQLATINKTLRKYEPLFELKKQLEGARRALLSERAPTAGGGRGLTQEEVVNALGTGSMTVAQVAAKLSASEGAVRAHFNRGAGERFESSKGSNGTVYWRVRDPENDDEEEEEDDE